MSSSQLTNNKNQAGVRSCYIPHWFLVSDLYTIRIIPTIRSQLGSRSATCLPRCPILAPRRGFRMEPWRNSDPNPWARSIRQQALFQCKAKQQTVWYPWPERKNDGDITAVLDSSLSHVLFLLDRIFKYSELSLVTDISLHLLQILACHYIHHVVFL